LNNGTSWSNAWTNLSSVVWGASGVKAGDTLYISGGSTSKTYTNTLTVGASGTAASRISIRVWQDAGHNGIVKIDGSGYGLSSTIDAIAVHRAYVTISGEVGGGTNLHIINWRNSTNKNYSRGIVGLDSSDITVSHCVITNVNTAVHLTGGTNKIIAYCNMLAYGDTVICLNSSKARPGNEWDSHLIFSNRITCMSLDTARGLGGPDGVQCLDGVSMFENVFRCSITTETNSSNHTDFLQSNGW